MRFMLQCGLAGTTEIAAAAAAAWRAIHQQLQNVYFFFNELAKALS